jgi:hypothetical protein
MLASNWDIKPIHETIIRISDPCIVGQLFKE